MPHLIVVQLCRRKCPLGLRDVPLSHNPMGHPTSYWSLLSIPSHSSMVPWDPMEHPISPWSGTGLGLGHVRARAGARVRARAGARVTVRARAG